MGVANLPPPIARIAHIGRKVQSIFMRFKVFGADGIHDLKHYANTELLLLFGGENRTIYSSYSAFISHQCLFGFVRRIVEHSTPFIAYDQFETSR